MKRLTKLFAFFLCFVLLFIMAVPTSAKAVNNDSADEVTEILTPELFNGLVLQMDLDSIILDEVSETNLQTPELPEEASVSSPGWKAIQEYRVDAIGLIVQLSEPHSGPVVSLKKDYGSRYHQNLVFYFNGVERWNFHIFWEQHQGQTHQDMVSVETRTSWETRICKGNDRDATRQATMDAIGNKAKSVLPDVLAGALLSLAIVAVEYIVQYWWLSLLLI